MNRKSTSPSPPQAPGPAEGLKPSDSYVQSFARGLDVLRSSGQARPAQTLSEAAESTGTLGRRGTGSPRQAQPALGKRRPCLYTACSQ
jgi:hypothetical protein